ncbi:hypothetical protein Tco_0724185 [Tanacetum coccineum]
MKTKAMSLTMSRRMTASIRRTSSTKLCSSSRALRTFTEQSHDEVRGCLKDGSGKGGRKIVAKEIMTIFDEFSILRSMDNVRSSLCMSTWMAFGGNTRDLGSFGEETDEITGLHQILEEVLLTEHGDGVVSIKRRHRDLFSDGARTWPT